MFAHTIQIPESLSTLICRPFSIMRSWLEHLDMIRLYVYGNDTHKYLSGLSSVLYSLYAKAFGEELMSANKLCVESVDHAGYFVHVGE